MALCALCLENADLRVSHVLPAFVFRWMRQRSVTGHIRFTENVNLRVQDGIKKPWLCETCENVFSRDETAFSSKLFYPWMRGQSEVEYEDWLLRFCTSVSWRVLKHCKGLNAAHNYTLEEDSAAIAAEVTWRRFLQNHTSGVGIFEQHLLVVDALDNSTVSDLPENISRYLAGYTEMDIIGTSKTMMTYAKLGKFIVFGMIRKGRGPWKGTKVFAQHGYIRPQRYVLPHSLLGFFSDRARICSDALKSMSPVQQAKVDAALLTNIGKMAGSDQLRAMIADADMFGDEAILRRT